MRPRKKGFTLVELQMASVLMIVVLIATGVIFYFCLACIRYLHDAVIVYSNANSAMKTLRNEIMVSNCWGASQGPAFATPQYSFYGQDGYIHGISTDEITVPAGRGLSGIEAINAYNFMPVMADGTDVIYLRQVRQTGSSGGSPATVEGDFPNHDIVAIFLDPGGSGEMRVSVETGPGNPDVVNGDYTVANHITAFSFQQIAYNCVALSVTATGTVPDPLGASASGQVYEITLSQMVTLRCAPTIRPWLN